MYVDLMSPYGFLQVNIKLANMLGLEAAAYWAELLNVYPRVIRKKQDELFSNGGFFVIDREYVESRTTITKERQIELDKALERVGALHSDPNDPNRIKIDVESMYAVIVEDDPKAIKEIQKKAKTRRDDATKAKREGIRLNLRTALIEQDPEVLSAMQLWIDTLVDGKKFMSKPTVTAFQTNLNSYTQSKAAKLKIIEIATTNGYNEFAWAKQVYEKSYSKPIGTFIGSQTPNGSGKIDPNSGF